MPSGESSAYPRASATWSVAVRVDHLRDPSVAVKDAADQDHAAGEVGSAQCDQQRDVRAGAVPHELCRAADDLLEKRDRVLAHQLVGDRARDIWRAPLATPLRRVDVEVGRERGEIWRPCPRSSSAGVQQHKRLAVAMLVIPGADLAKLNVATHGITPDSGRS